MPIIAYFQRLFAERFSSTLRRFRARCHAIFAFAGFRLFAFTPLLLFVFHAYLIDYLRHITLIFRYLRLRRFADYVS